MALKEERVELRQANYQDFERIAQLHAKSWQQHYRGLVTDAYLEQYAEDDRVIVWQTRLTNPSFNQNVLVLENEGELCGFICIYGNHNFEYGTIIDNLHVDSAYQGHGLGTKLMLEAAKWAEKYFPDSGVYLEVLEQNVAAKHFYLALGATQSHLSDWSAPCGSKVKEAVFTWSSPSVLLKKAETFV
ncbi:N-acetyltransferase [Vibrio sp. vnigr-6D03]|nr:N-acetyltransferase [Vibrio sp. vnigr-6D03]RTZ22310.1 GNAT family N-acetyltransferase [Vibrio penaeicida]